MLKYKIAHFFLTKQYAYISVKLFMDKFIPNIFENKFLHIYCIYMFYIRHTVLQYSLALYRQPKDIFLVSTEYSFLLSYLTI